MQSEAVWILYRFLNLDFQAVFLITGELIAGWLITGWLITGWLITGWLMVAHELPRHFGGLIERIIEAASDKRGHYPFPLAKISEKKLVSWLSLFAGLLGPRISMNRTLLHFVDKSPSRTYLINEDLCP